MTTARQEAEQELAYAVGKERAAALLNAVAAEVLRTTAPRLRRLHDTMPNGGRTKFGQGVLHAANALDEWAETGARPAPAAVAEQPPAADPWPAIDRLTTWLDTHNGRGATETALRLLKVSEEAGEVAQAWIGATGQNPRKGTTHTLADVADELCDVITAAMVALATITTEPAAHFARKVEQIAALRLDDAAARGDNQ